MDFDPWAWVDHRNPKILANSASSNGSHRVDSLLAKHVLSFNSTVAFQSVAKSSTGPSFMSENQPQKSADAKTRKKRAVASGKKPRRRLLIKVHPEDLKREKLSMAEKVKKEATSGVPGLLVSLGFHLLILLFLAFLVVRSQEADNSETLDMGWLSERSDSAAQSTRAPVRIGALKKSFKKKTPKKKKSSNTKKSTKSAAGVPVKPPPVKQSLANRNPRVRAGIMAKNGGSNRTKNAVNLALGWLSRQQRSRGNWQLHTGYLDAGRPNLKSDTGATALALLAYLGAGHTHVEGDYQSVVGNGLRWLTGTQDPEGNLHEPAEYGWKPTYYAHSMATIALCEAYALTGDETLREPSIRAIQFLIDSQHPVKGGWRYVKQTKLTNGDLSVTSWALMALNTARMAGLEVPEEDLQRTSFFIDSVQELGGARYKYEPTDPIGQVTPARTAVGLLCRQWLGWPKDYPMMQSGVKFLLEREGEPQWSGGRRNVYAWYYMAQVLHNLGGDDWKKWYQSVHNTILENQNRRGSKEGSKDVRGSWHPSDPPGHPEEYADQVGRLYLTAMCVLILETPVRHSPIYVEEPASKPETAAGAGEE